MTPEERARRTVFDLYQPHSARHQNEATVADAIREAENDAYERAAQVAHRYIGCEGVEKDIRALKTESVE